MAQSMPGHLFQGRRRDDTPTFR